MVTTIHQNPEIHIPVLLKESLDYLITRLDGTYVDCTFGMGGHSYGILKRISKDGILIAFEWDEKQADFALETKKTIFMNPSFFLIKESFINLDYHLKKKKIEKVDGVLLDLGLSSFQIESEHYGLSFRKEAKLNMVVSTPNDNKNITAYEVINKFSSETLADIFKRFGEERLAKKIANKIIKRRKIKSIETTQELVNLVASCFEKKGKKHPARKVFQALRIYLNKELENLEKVLLGSFNHLEINGRIVVISYNSLEDKIVKRIFREKENTGNFLILTKKVIVPTKEEISTNNKARSAKMRVIEKI